MEQNYQQLKEELGLDHYERRGWQGWHHHVTLVCLAYAFLLLERRRFKKTPVRLCLKRGDVSKWYEAIHMIRKGQAHWVSDADVRKQNQFIDRLFDLAA